MEQYRGCALFRNLGKRGKPRKVYSNFLPGFSVPFEISGNRLNGSRFGNSTILGYPGNFPRKFP